MLLVGLLLLIAGAELTHARPADSQSGSAERGRTLFGSYCGACHRMQGISVATGVIGPDLTGWESQPLIAGVAPNTPQNLARWLTNPQTVKADAIMLPLGLTSAQVDDLVAFLLPPPPPAGDPTPEDSPAEATE
jgi:cytochrome c oxidase subunit 2